MKKGKTMRITGGKLVRRRFLIPPLVDENVVRPTPDRVREALFSMLMNYLEDAFILDIFAGSGAHGFEALSRGAKDVIFVEKNPSIGKILEENISLLNLNEQCTIIQRDALAFIREEPEKKADIIFIDPPYKLKLAKDFFTCCQNYLHPHGLIVFRCFKKDRPVFPDDFNIIKDRTYGSTRVFILQKD